MGWSIDTARPALNRIFKETDTKYRITHPQTNQQTVTIEYLGNEDIPNRVKKRLAELFPDFVYVELVLVQASQTVAKQMEWDN